MKKLMSILLVLLMLTSVLASCGGNDETTTTEAPTTEAPTTEAPTTEAPTTEAPAPEIPTPVQNWSSKTDIRDTWSGKTLNVACSAWYSTSAPWAMPETFITEENDAKFGEEIQKAVLDRNEFIEKTYGVKVNWLNTTKASMPDALEKATLAKNVNYDLAAPRMMNVQAIVAGGYVYDLANREFIDFNNTYYSSDSVKTYTAHGHTFFVTGSFSILDIETAGVLYFNKNLLPDVNEKATDDLYNLVREGKWTFDRLCTYAEATYSDNGDGILSNNDTFVAVISQFTKYYDYFGVKQAGINEATGEWELAINDDRVDDVISAIIKSNTAKKEIFTSLGGSRTFQGGGALFLTEVLQYANNVNIDVDVGIVPFPMLNEEQGRYYVPCSDQMSVAMCIPKLTQDRNMSEYFMDVLFWTAQEYTMKTYLEQKSELFETDAEIEMITEYIIPNISYDAGVSVGWGTLINIKSDSYKGNENHFDEVYEKKAPDALKTIEEWNKAWSSYVEDDPRPKPPVTEETPVHIHKETVIQGKKATTMQTGLTDGIKCSECGKILKYQSVIPALEIVDGLKFRLNEDEASYAVIGLGDYTDNNLIIPSEYNGLPITRIEKNAFKEETSLLSVIIPSRVTYIGISAFEGCSGITSVNLSEGLTYIGNHAFNGCKSLEEIKMPDSILNAGIGAFMNCTSLKKVEISKGIKAINTHTFAQCTALSTVIIPDSVTRIGKGAFYNCDSLKSIPIGNNVSVINSYAFERCDGFTEITIPDSVTRLGENAFAYCKNLTNLVIGKGVTYIERTAFEGCSKLNYVELTVKNGWYMSHYYYPEIIDDIPFETIDPSILAGHFSGELSDHNWNPWFRK
ncbi:MAG: leucine-rich repeat protein [Clostridia bacterium]|nr:leucine-rich repeat protein [Clostridia bacterium]